MTSPVIYHGTPITPRAALVAVCTGRALCVSYHHPQDAEVAAEISPAIMFRQRGVFFLASSTAARRRMGRDTKLASIFQVAGIKTFPPRKMGDYAGYSWRTFSVERFCSQ